MGGSSVCRTMDRAVELRSRLVAAKQGSSTTEWPGRLRWWKYILLTKVRCTRAAGQYDRCALEVQGDGA
jgi:hypothetical protein